MKLSANLPANLPGNLQAKLRVGRLTVHGPGLDARRLADQLAQDLPGALARALSGAPPGPGPVDQAAGVLAARIRAAAAALPVPR